MVEHGNTARPPIRAAAQRPKDWLKLYLITDCGLFPEHRLLDSLEAALKGGVRDLQLREKEWPLDKLFPLAMVLRQMTLKYGARLYINDRLDIALMVEADGVHLPEGGLPANEVKARYPHLTVGVSTHSPESARKAEAEGADFVTFGPVFDTPSKRQYGPPQGLDRLQEATAAVSLPVLALGGVKRDNLDSVFDRGAWGAALITGIWNSPNIQRETESFMENISRRLSL